MNNEQLKNHIDRHLTRMEGKINAILQLVTEHLGDPLTIADLQRRLNESQKALREMEMEDFFKNFQP